MASLRGQQLPFRSYSLRDGLLSTSSYIFFQDRTNYLWIATDGGLSRFDGRHFTNFEKTPEGRSLGIIISLVQTADGRIWAGGNGSGLFEFDGKNFIHHAIGHEAGSNLVTALCEIEPNVLLIGTEQGVFRQQKGVIRPLLKDARMLRTFKFSASGDLIKTHNGRIRALIGGNVYSIDPKTGNCSDSLWRPHPTDHFDWIAPLTNGRLVVGCINQGRVYIFQGNTLLQTLALPDCRPRYALDDGKGDLWIATDKGFLRTKSEQPTLVNAVWITTSNGLPFSRVSTAFFDQEHNLWIGSYGKGIYKLEETETYRFSYPFGAGLGCADTKGRLWFSTTDGLHVIKRNPNGTLTQQAIAPFSPHYFKSMGVVKSQANNQLWLGSDDDHIANFQIEELVSGRLAVRFLRELGPRTGLPPLKPSWLFIDSKQRIWVSEKDKPVLYVLDITQEKPRLLKKIGFDPGKRLSNGRNLIEDATGNFWFVYERNNVLVFNADLTLKQTIKKLLPDRDVDISCVHQDRDGAFWFGTDLVGLIRRTADGRVRQLSSANGLLSDRIIGITEGLDHTLWVSTWQGLAFIHYQGDSLQLSENREVTESPSWSLGVWPDGLGWVATNFEVVFHKKRSIAQSIRPTIVLNSVFVNGEERPISPDEVRLSAEENNLIFNFGSVYFQSRNSLWFRWKLDGSASQWSQPSALESVNFAGLKPGDYVFKVKAMTSDGLESPIPAQFSFTIVPPIWEQWWFGLTCLALFMGITWFLFSLRLRRLLEIERLRSSIAADLHDDIGSGLTRIALTSELLLRQKNEPAQAKQTALFQRIGDTSRELIEAMSDIVWSIDPKNDSLEKVIDRIQIFANDICEARGITVDVSINTEAEIRSRKLRSDIVSSLVLVAKEAVTNAVRHSQCTHILLRVEASSQQLRLTITDDGTGFDEATLSRVNGLVNMRRRATKIGGNLYVTTIENLGTKIVFHYSIT